MTTFLVMTLAGAAGALCRYLVSGIVQEKTGSDYPIGTLSVNLSGAFLIGLAAGGSWLGPDTSTAVFGFLGGYTTFSTWMIETLRLGLPSGRPRAVWNLTITLLLGVGLTALGYSLAR